MTKKKKAYYWDLLYSPEDNLSTQEVFAEVGFSGAHKNPLSESDKKACGDEVMKFVINFPHDKESNGSKLIDQWQSGKFNPWFYLRFRSFVALHKSLIAIRSVERLLVDYDQVTVVTSNALLEKEHFQAGVDIDYRPVGKSNAGLLGKLNPLVSYTMFCAQKWINHILAGKKDSSELLVIDRPSDRRLILGADGVSKIKHNSLGEFLERTSINFHRLKQQSIPKLTEKKFKRLPDHEEGLNGEAILLSGNLLNRWKKTKELVQQFKLSLTTSSASTTLEKLMFKQLASNAGSLHLFYWKHLSYLRFFDKNDYKILLTIDEQGPLIRPIIDAAEQHKVRVVSVQHGAIHPLNASHRYHPDDHNHCGSIETFFCWGENSAKRLIESNVFLKKQIKIVGQQRTDIIPSLAKRNNTIHLTVLLATQPLPDQALMMRYVVDTFTSLAAADYSGRLVIRPHYSERDFSFYESLIRSHPDLSIEIDPTTDLYVALAESNLLLTAYSTVGIEALYFNLPVITYDYTQEDLLGLSKAGVGFAATDEQTLVDLLSTFVTKGLKTDQNNLNDFVKKSAFAIDGQVSSRMDDEINSLIQSF